MSHRLQWTLFFVPIALLFCVALYFILGNKPRDIYVGEFSTQNAAVAAALSSMQSALEKYPNSASLTVHFRGPHPISGRGEEAFSYNRRLGVLIAFLNRRSEGQWKFIKLLCPNTNDARLKELAQKSDLLLESPADCGCTIEKPAAFGGVR